MMNDMTNEFIEKLKVINIKDGDCLVVKYKDCNFANINIPRDVYIKYMAKQLKDIKEYFDINYNKKGIKFGLICVPDSIDFEVIRLEEWYV